MSLQLVGPDGCNIGVASEMLRDFSERGTLLLV